MRTKRFVVAIRCWSNIVCIPRVGRWKMLCDDNEAVDVIAGDDVACVVVGDNEAVVVGLFCSLKMSGRSLQQF